jgi:tRNA U34 5-methylaminomethyl-2-thiouridine-forming methyltransferase MnmC
LKQLVITEDGSHTIYIPELDEHYHSVHGAIQESEHIFIRSGYDTCSANPMRIFEVGFGTGLNAFLTSLKASEGTRKIIYSSIEKYPLDVDFVRSLNYTSQYGKKGSDIFDLIHSAPWNTETELSSFFSLLKVEADLIAFAPEGKYDLIYFDAFGPDKQPLMWSAEIFRKLSDATEKGGIFVTYSAKGEVKRNLKACGFEVSLLPGPPGKRQIIRAVKM